MHEHVHQVLQAAVFCVLVMTLSFWASATRAVTVLRSGIFLTDALCAFRLALETGKRAVRGVAGVRREGTAYSSITGDHSKWDLRYPQKPTICIYLFLLGGP